MVIRGDLWGCTGVVLSKLLINLNYIANEFLTQFSYYLNYAG